MSEPRSLELSQDQLISTALCAKSIFLDMPRSCVVVTQHSCGNRSLTQTVELELVRGEKSGQQESCRSNPGLKVRPEF